MPSHPKVLRPVADHAVTILANVIRSPSDLYGASTCSEADVLNAMYAVARLYPADARIRQGIRKFQKSMWRA